LASTSGTLAPPPRSVSVLGVVLADAPLVITMGGGVVTSIGVLGVTADGADGIKPGSCNSVTTGVICTTTDCW
jgi:hypothetical protein